MCKPHIGLCTKTNVKMTKDEYNTQSYCMILKKESKCVECGFSQNLHKLG